MRHPPPDERPTTLGLIKTPSARLWCPDGLRTVVGAAVEPTAAPGKLRFTGHKCRHAACTCSAPAARLGFPPLAVISEEESS
ncbi:hypothetical protein BN6_64820 [Saccharothrix espanaensis DSM 44229]|uniref:Uncharacterized protein n=1 Tax=Saccharothrix espanaensis (strain ATCC 51144 / DSM 44229 / JCM 9112 / NBRC 15066 / NRRL 15764) TaxID=1179773 RepID=K0K0F4_SACES|nr:hypothetical protein BN6_64820 [Saccharothrix espanaensis DSM 44229]